MPPWLDEEVRNDMKIQDDLKDKAKWKDYKRERNLVTIMIKRKKKKVISEIIAKKIDAKPVWDALRVCPMRDSSSLENTCLTPDDFNKHFTSIARTIYENIQARPHDQHAATGFTTKTSERI